MTEYVIDAHALQNAQQESGHRPQGVALSAQRLDDGAPVYVRYDALRLGDVRPLDSTHVAVRAPQRRGHRIAGPILLGIGITAVVAAIAVTSADLGRGCPQYGECWQGVLAAVVGAPLGVIGIGLVIPGGILTYQGYHQPTEVVPSERGLFYLSH